MTIISVQGDPTLISELDGRPPLCRSHGVVPTVMQQCGIFRTMSEGTGPQVLVMVAPGRVLNSVSSFVS